MHALMKLSEEGERVFPVRNYLDHNQVLRCDRDIYNTRHNCGFCKPSSEDRVTKNDKFPHINSIQLNLFPQTNKKGTKYRNKAYIQSTKVSDSYWFFLYM